jgi:hypothetical protein
MLRTCKTLRNKWLPLLASCTDSTLEIYHWKHLNRVADFYAAADYASRLLPAVEISLPFRAQIKRLEFDSYTNFLPDVALFPYLEEVKVLMVPAIRLRDRAVLGDEGALMAVSRWVTGEQRGFWARRAVEGALVEPMGVVEGWCWVGDMVRRLVGVCAGGMGRERERETKVNVVVEHVVIEWKGWWAWPGVDVVW